MTAPTPPIPPPNNGYAFPPPSGPNNPGPSAELTALAGHLRRISDRVEDLYTRCDQLTDTLIATVLPRLDSITTDTAAQLAEHSDQVQQLLDSLTTHRATEPVDWPAMNVEQAEVAWKTLADWIADTLVPWYEITRDQLPDCWALHRPAVIQLAWLHHTYRHAHDPGAGPRATADWHTRWLPAVLRTVREAIPQRGTRTCGPGHHLVDESERARRHPTSFLPPAGSRAVPTAWGLSNEWCNWV